MTPQAFEQFLAAYIECALWSSTDNSRDDGGDPLDRNYSLDDIAPETLAQMRADCEAFTASPEWEAAYADDFWTASQGGHDFWLTRNGHGAGFWDRYWRDDDGEAHGRALSDLARGFGGFDLYIGDDGRVYG